MRDAIRVCRATSNGPAREQRAIRQLAAMLDLDGKKVRVIEDVCEQDENILSGAVSDSKIAATAKELVARATSVGVPVAAVYLSGSVTGLGRRRHRRRTRGPRNGWRAGSVRHGGGQSAWSSSWEGPRTRVFDGFWGGPSATARRFGS